MDSNKNKVSNNYGDLSRSLPGLSWIFLLFFYPFRQLGEFTFRFDILLISVFIVVSSITYWKNILALLSTKTYLFFLGFIVYTIILNSYFAFKLNSIQFYFHSGLLFGLLLFIANVQVLFQNEFLYNIKSSVLVLFLSLTIQALYVFFFPHNVRESAFFENPNQLGRAAVFILAVFSLIQYKTKVIPNSIFILSNIIALYLSIASLSRAAMAAVVLLLLINLIFWFKPTLIAIIISLFFLLLFMTFQTKDSVNRLNEVSFRFIEENEGYNKLQNRGYVRFIKYPEYILFGAGESKQIRFDKNNYEFHSTFGNILFSYGIIGFLLFLLFFKDCFIPIKLEIVFLLPFLVHSLSHNDIRNIYFWLFIVLFIVTKEITGMEVKSSSHNNNRA